MGKNLALEILSWHDKFIDPGLLHVAYVFRRDSPPFLDDELTAQLNVEVRGFPTQALGHEAHANFFRRQIKVIGLKEDFQHLFVIQTKGTQDYRDR